MDNSFIGTGELPDSIRFSSILSPANLTALGNVQSIPLIDPSFYDDRLKNIVQYYSISPLEMEKELHVYAAELLNAGNVDGAWQVLLSGDIF